ncbi:MAG TPA: ATP-binding cassette domain-containing protein [Treponemataceae bacterium]|nr:ATP-binding cassette domain-containing protein [Treponemataceae bacterium]
MAIIEVEHLCRSFDYYEKAGGIGGSIGNLFSRKKLVKEAVRDVSFSIEGGTTVGFLGPNGAGKTTTLKMLSGIMHPSSGEARVLGHVPWARKKDFRRRISIVMGQRSQLWPDLPAIESFDLNRAIYEIDRAEYRSTLDELVAAFAVEDQLKVQVRRLSLGERMKMEIIAALLHRPSVLFLDEPTIGLDIVSQRAIRDMLRGLNARFGTTVMLTSHYLSDIEDLCERIILINHGSVVYDGALSGVNATLADRKTVRLVLSEKLDESRLSSFPGYKSSDGSTAVFEVDRAKVREFSRKALDALPVADLTIEDMPLEEGIARLYRGEAPDA